MIGGLQHFVCFISVRLSTNNILLSPYEQQGRNSDTSTAESASDVDDLGSLMIRRTWEYSRLAPVREEVSFLPES